MKHIIPMPCKPMRNRRNILVIICLLAITTAWAEPISESQPLDAVKHLEKSPQGPYGSN